MGLQNLIGILETDLSLEEKVSWHLSSNCYPPVPKVFHPACLTAIKLVANGEADKDIELPDGVFYRNQAKAPAHAIVENFHLDLFIGVAEKEGGDDG